MKIPSPFSRHSFRRVKQTFPEEDAQVDNHLHNMHLGMLLNRLEHVAGEKPDREMTPRHAKTWAIARAKRWVYAEAAFYLLRGQPDRARSIMLSNEIWEVPHETE